MLRPTKLDQQSCGPPIYYYGSSISIEIDRPGRHGCLLVPELSDPKARMLWAQLYYIFLFTLWDHQVKS
jgi:hypothetical protein